METNRPNERAGRNGEGGVSRGALELAVERGLISGAQRDAILSLEPAAAAPAESGAPEAREGFNAATVAYWAGAIVVLFALGWALVDRWDTLGAGGVLVVSAAYAIIFTIVARWLLRREFRLAASFATLLVVMLVPVMTWSVMSLLGFWPARRPVSRPPMFRPPTVADSARWIPIDVLTIAAALVALRWRRFAVLVVPAAVGFWYLLLHSVPLVLAPTLARELEGFVALVAGTTLIGAGHAVDRRRPDRSDDYAFWLYLVGIVALVFASGETWNRHQNVVPHVVLALSILSVVLSLTLGRRLFLVSAVIGSISYLSWLAFDVFRRTAFFPIVLAAFGLTIILAAVWVQRRYPSLARRMAAQRAGAGRDVPGGNWGFVAAVVLALLLFVRELPDAHRRELDRARREREFELRAREGPR